MDCKWKRSNDGQAVTRSLTLFTISCQGLFSDSTILDVSDVELVDLKFLESEPIIVVQFTCQQINCQRDKFGNVVEGGPQDVQRVRLFLPRV